MPSCYGQADFLATNKAVKRPSKNRPTEKPEQMRFGQFLLIPVQALQFIPECFDVYTCMGEREGSAPLCLGVGGRKGCSKCAHVDNLKG